MQQEYKDKLREVVKSMAEQGYEQSEIERIIKRYNKRYNEYDLPGQVKPQKQKPVSTDTTTTDPGKEDAQQQTSGDAAAGQDNTASTSETTSSESQENNQEPEVSKAEELAGLTDKDFISQIKELNPALGAAEFTPAGVFAGNAVRVKLPGQNSITIDLKAFSDKGDEEAQAQIQQLLDYENEKGGALNVANLDRDFNVDIPAFNDAYKGTGFTLNGITRAQQNEEFKNIKEQGGDPRGSELMDAMRRQAKFRGTGGIHEILDDNGKRVWIGPASELNDWLNANLSEDQVNVVNSNLKGFASSEINERNKMMEDRQKNEEFSRKSTDVKYIKDKEFSNVNNLQGNLGFTSKEARVINDFIEDNPEVLKNPELLDNLKLDYGQGRFSPTGG